MSNVEQLVDEGRVIELHEVNLKYEQYKDIVEKSQYLEDISEDKIYDVYREAIRQDHNMPFKEFTQDERDAYLRLKLKGLIFHSPERDY